MKTLIESTGIYRSLVTKSEEERDESVKLFVCLIGISYLFPFPALTQCVDYWNNIFPNYSTMFWISAICMWAMFISLFVLVIFKPIGENPTRILYEFRMYFGSYGQLLCFLVIPFCDILRFKLSIINEQTHFVLIMCDVAICSICTALIDSMMISYVSHFHHNLQNTLQLGVGCSILIAASYAIITKLVVPPEYPYIAAYLYFGLGVLTVIGCIFSFAVLQQIFDLIAISPIHHSESKVTIDEADIQTNSPSYDKVAKVELGDISTMIIVGDSCELAGADGDTDHAVTRVDDHDAIINTDDNAQSLSFLDIWHRRYKALRPVLFYEFLMASTFACTLFLWPSAIASIESSWSPSLNDNDWWKLILLFIFSLSDVIGRQSIQATKRFGISAKTLWIPVGLRLLLIPLLFGAITQIYLTQDVIVILLVIAFGFSYGYVSTLSLMIINESTIPKDRPLVGSFTCFFLDGGLVFGSSLALIFQSIGGFRTHRS